MRHIFLYGLLGFFTFGCTSIRSVGDLRNPASSSEGTGLLDPEKPLRLATFKFKPDACLQTDSPRGQLKVRIFQPNTFGCMYSINLKGSEEFRDVTGVYGIRNTIILNSNVGQNKDYC